MLPAYVPQGQNTCVASLRDLVTSAAVMNLLQLEVRHIVPLKLPGGLPWARAGEDERRALDQDELFVLGCDLQAARLSAEIQEGCRWHNKSKGVRLEVKDTAAWGQGLNQQYMPDPVLSLNDEGYGLPGEDVWEDNDAFVSDRLIQNVSLNASKYFVISQAPLLISDPKRHFFLKVPVCRIYVELLA